MQNEQLPTELTERLSEAVVLIGSLERQIVGSTIKQVPQPSYVHILEVLLHVKDLINPALQAGQADSQ